MFGDEDNYHSDWLGFEGVDFHVSIDLGEAKAIRAVKIDFLENIKSWIFLPDNIEVSLSDDGENFQTVKTIEIETRLAERKGESHLFEFSFEGTEARFIQIIAKNIGTCPDWHPGAGGKCWLFVDEVVVE